MGEVGHDNEEGQEEHASAGAQENGLKSPRKLNVGASRDSDCWEAKMHERASQWMKLQQKDRERASQWMKLQQTLLSADCFSAAQNPKEPHFQILS